jgi:hypothetical protein
LLDCRTSGYNHRRMFARPKTTPVQTSRVTMKCTGAGNAGLAQTTRDGLRHIIIPLRLRSRLLPAR